MPTLDIHPAVRIMISRGVESGPRSAVGAVGPDLKSRLKVLGCPRQGRQIISRSVRSSLKNRTGYPISDLVYPNPVQQYPTLDFTPTGIFFTPLRQAGYPISDWGYPT